jgi:hypothetical protein
MDAPRYEIPKYDYVYPQSQDVQRPIYVIPVQRQKPILSPRGVPNRSLFIVGAVGMFLTAAIAICLGVLGLFSFQYFFYGFFSGSLAIISLILGVLFYIGLLMGLFGFYGFYRNYGSGMGVAAFGFGIIATTFFLVSQIVSVLAVNASPWYYGPSILALLISIVGLILLGVLFIIEGVSFMTARHFSQTGEINLAAGMMFVLAGSFFCSFFIAYFGGFIILAVSAIIGGIVFVKSPIPVLISEVPVSKKGAIRKRAGKPERIINNAPSDAYDESMPDEDAR